jgi:predicted metal-dependent phosphoesterase TrpH
MGALAPAGRVRVDCHLHTVASGDAVLTLDQLAERARQTGLDVVCITDHNVTTAAVQATERDLGVRVVVGEEIRTPDGDVIGLFLTERIPYVLPLAEVIARIKAQGGLVYVPHPFDRGRSSLGRVLPGLCAERAVDIIEVFNAKISDPTLNHQAADLAGRFDLPGGAGSDAHDAPGVGAAYLEMPDFDGPAGFLAALADAQLTGEFRDHAVRYPRRSVLPRPRCGVTPRARIASRTTSLSAPSPLRLSGDGQRGARVLGERQCLLREPGARDGVGQDRVGLEAPERIEGLEGRAGTARPSRD